MRTTKTPIWPRGCAGWRVFVGRTCQVVHSFTLRLKYALTFTTLWASSADDKLILFLIQMSNPVVLGKIRKIFQYVVCWKFYPESKALKYMGHVMQKRPWSQTWQKPISACMPTWFDPGLNYPLTDSFQYRKFAWIVKLCFLEKKEVFDLFCRQRVVKSTKRSVFIRVA